MPILALAFLMSQSSAPLEVPFRVTDDAMVVDATVNGAQVSLMVDTGFSGYVLMRQGIDIGKPSGEQKLRDFVGEFSAVTVPLKSLSIGGQKVNTENAVVVQQPMRNMSVSYNTHVDGILGLSGLRQRLFEINFERKVFRFFPEGQSLVGKQPAAGGFSSTLLPIGHSALQMSVETKAGHKLTMGLDTGNAFYATTHRDVLERVGLWSPEMKPKYMRVSGVASGAVESWSAHMKNLSIFGVPVPESVWDVIDLPSSSAEMDGTIGYQFLRNFNITVDFANRIVWLQNFTGKYAENVKGDLGIVSAFSPTLRRMTILDISPESPAAVAGVKEGDEIISLNGRDLSRENYIQMRRMFEGPPGSVVNLAVSRGGALIRFQLNRQVLANDVKP